MKFTDHFRINALHPEEVKRQIESRERFKSSAIRNAIKPLIEQATPRIKLLERGYNVLIEKGEDPANLKQMSLEEIVKFRNVGDYNRSPKTDITDLLYISAQDIEQHPLFSKLKDQMSQNGISVRVVNDPTDMAADKTPVAYFSFTQVNQPGQPLGTGVRQDRQVVKYKGDTSRQQTDPFSDYLGSCLREKRLAVQQDISRIISGLDREKMRETVIRLQDKFYETAEKPIIRSRPYRFPEDFPSTLAFNDSDAADIVGPIEGAHIGNHSFDWNVELANLRGQYLYNNVLIMAYTTKKGTEIVFQYALENDPDIDQYLYALHGGFGGAGGPPKPGLEGP